MALTLAVVETAIETIITTGQSFSVDGMTYSKANIALLWDARKQLKAEADRASRPTVRAFGFGGMAYSGGDATNVTPVATDPVP